MTGETPFPDSCNQIPPAVAGGPIAVPLMAQKEAG
jgi:hypothetical protein